MCHAVICHNVIVIMLMSAVMYRAIMHSAIMVHVFILSACYIECCGAYQICMLTAGLLVFSSSHHACQNHLAISVKLRSLFDVF